MARMRSRASTNFRIEPDYTTAWISRSSVGQTDDNMGDNASSTFAYGTQLGERGHFVGSVENQNIDPIEYDPTELGDWFQRYGIVGEPGVDDRRRQRTSAAAARAARTSTRDNHAPTGRIGAAPQRCRSEQLARSRSVAKSSDGTQRLAGVRPFASTGDLDRRGNRQSIGRHGARRHGGGSR